MTPPTDLPHRAPPIAFAATSAVALTAFIVFCMYLLPNANWMVICAVGWVCSEFGGVYRMKRLERQRDEAILLAERLVK